MTVEPSSSALHTRLQRHSTSNSSLAIAFLWSLAEATLFFVVPDVYLGFVALVCWRKGLLATLASLAGSMIGGAIMYTLAAANRAAINQLLTWIPLIGPEMVRSVADQMHRSGLVAMVSGPLQAIPYKIYAAQAGQLHLPLIPFLLITIPARLERLLPVVLASAALGTAFKNFVQRHALLVIGVYVLMWAGVYALYYLHLR